MVRCGFPVFFYENDRYYGNIPFITKEDIKERRLIIRDFEIDRDYYERMKRKGGGWELCYKANCRIIAKYATVELMARDGWLVDKNPRHSF